MARLDRLLQGVDFECGQTFETFEGVLRGEAPVCVKTQLDVCRGKFLADVGYQFKLILETDSSDFKLYTMEPVVKLLAYPAAHCGFVSHPYQPVYPDALIAFKPRGFTPGGRVESTPKQRRLESCTDGGDPGQRAHHLLQRAAL